MSRTSETLAYAVVATLLVCGSLYALARYAQSSAPPAQQQVARLPEPPAGIPASTQNPAAPAPAMAPRPSAAPSENVVRTSTKTYYLPSTSPDESDQNTYNALRRNCYDAARSNAQGQYPALQQAACNSFADFARRKGWETGQLPAYGTPPPQAQVAYTEQREPDDNSAQCADLLAEEQLIEAAMRAGYQEPLGNWYRKRKAEVEEQLWKLHCPRR
jgi:hypothetical protein